MKRLYFFLIFCLEFCRVPAQQNVIDSLKQVLNNVRNDSTAFILLTQIGELYTFNNADSSLLYINKASALAQRNQNSLWKAHANYSLSLYFFVVSDYAAALNYAFSSINGLKQNQDVFLYAIGIHMLALLYEENDLFAEAKAYAFQTLDVLNVIKETTKIDNAHFLNSKGKTAIAAYLVLTRIQLKLHDIGAALRYGEQANKINLERGVNWNAPIYNLALIYQKAGYTDKALSLYREALLVAIKENILKDVVDDHNGIANQLLKKGQNDSAIYYAQKAYTFTKDINYKQGVLEATLLLSEAYEKRHRRDSAFQYYKQAMAIKDSLFNQEKIHQVQSIAFKEELKQQELRQKIAAEQTLFRNQIRLYMAIGIVLILLAIALLLWRNNRQKQKAKIEIEKAYENLKSTQAQLIQQEKMASLGELTAGIAHEIQNPLNFVNNFSEVSNELLDEMKTELATGNGQEALTIADDVKQNLEKIIHHGKRADAIVKGMLQHSRASTGKKEPTDVNALADEYLRLSYHGMRAKDKSFNATLQTDFDSGIGKINVVPQDIGRVLLNLFNNAFYAVMQKKNTPSLNHYEPTVSISTKKITSSPGAETIEIHVKDNGTGIPQKAVDKVFQPFFTTKPAGQGTGLGLSLAYDIIKAHGGEMKVNSKEGEGAEFVVLLPI